MAEVSVKKRRGTRWGCGHGTRQRARVLRVGRGVLGVYARCLNRKGEGEMQGGGETRERGREVPRGGGAYKCARLSCSAMVSDSKAAGPAVLTMSIKT